MIKIDKYTFEFFTPIKSWKIEATNNQNAKKLACLDKRTEKIEKEVKYEFDVSNCDKSYKYFRLKMTEPNESGKWYL